MRVRTNADLRALVRYPLPEGGQLTVPLLQLRHHRCQRREAHLSLNNKIHC